MAKRFGRQQKRKMREKIKKLEQDVRWMKVNMVRNQKIVDDTARVLGRHFITLPPQTVEVRRLDALANGWRMAVENGWPLRRSSMYPDAVATDSFLEILLPVMSGDVRHQLGQHMHVQFEYNGQRVGYAIREESLRMMPSEMALLEISRAMASQLVSHIQKNEILEA